MSSNSTFIENISGYDNLMEYCYNSSVEKVIPANVIFWIEGIGLGFVSIFGICGNILTVVVLKKISLNNVFNQLIVALCVCDSFFNGFSFFELFDEKRF